MSELCVELGSVLDGEEGGPHGVADGFGGDGFFDEVFSEDVRPLGGNSQLASLIRNRENQSIFCAPVEGLD
jgi:hypothetical protein